MTDSRPQARALHPMTQLYTALRNINEAVLLRVKTREGLFAKVCEALVGIWQLEDGVGRLERPGHLQGQSCKPYRMPIFLEPTALNTWMKAATPDIAMAVLLAAPFPDRVARPVRRAMSSPRFEDPSAVEPVEVH